MDLADQIKQRDTNPVGIWPENLTSVNAFFELERFWVAGKSIDGSARMVLDNGQIKNTLELMGVKRRAWPEVFSDLKVMETEASNALFGDAE